MRSIIPPATRLVSILPSCAPVNLPSHRPPAGQQPVHRCRIGRDPLASVRRGPLGGARFQVVRRAGASQRIIPVAGSYSARTLQIRCAHQQRRHAVTAQLLVIVQIVVTERQRADALPRQRPNAVLHAIGVAVVAEPPRQTIQQTQTLVRLPQQHPTGVGGDPTAVESTDDMRRLREVKMKLLACTLCGHGTSPSV